MDLTKQNAKYLFQAEAEELAIKVDALTSENLTLKSEINRLTDNSQKLKLQNAKLTVRHGIQISLLIIYILVKIIYIIIIFRDTGKTEKRARRK